jgi:multiple sugar transport system substrate-binding protein
MPESLAVPFLEAGSLLDLNAVTRENPDYNFADMSESAMSLYLRDDAVFGIPFSTSPELIYFNRDLFEAAGLETPDVLQARGEWTWDALRTAAQAIKEATDVYGFQSHGQSIYGVHLWHNLAPLTRAFGGDVWSADGTECLLDTPESRAAIQFYHDMVFVDGSTVPPGVEADFNAGSAAMTIGFLSQSARLVDAGFAWGIASLPEGPAGQVSVIGQSSIVAFQNSRNPEVAADFVAFITNQQNVTTMAQFFPPIRASVLNSGDFANANPAVAPEALEVSVVPSILNGSLLPTHVEFPKIDLAGRAAFDALWNPQGDVEAVTAAVCEAIEAFMN